MTNLARQPVDVDYTLQQRISKAMRRLQEGDEGDDCSPLFALRISRRASEATLSQADEENNNNNMEDNEVESPFGTFGDDGPVGSPENATGNYVASFAFGEEDPNFVPNAADPDEDGGDGIDMIMSEKEDQRRRTTMKRKSRNAISGETVDPLAAMSFHREAVEKSSALRDTILAALETHHLFSHLDDNDLIRIADIMKVINFDSGDNIVSKLDPSDEFFVICSGGAEITEMEINNEMMQSFSNASPDASPARGSGGATTIHKVGSKLREGAAFGDLALMHESCSPETVVATVDGTVVCSIDRYAYKNICMKAAFEKRERYEGFLRKVRFLDGLTNDERLRLGEALKSAKYSKGENIISYGEEGKWFNIILEGRIDVIGRDDRGKEVYVCSFEAGDCVGELEFLRGHKTVADCVAATDIVKTAKMARNHFEKVIGPAKDVLERQAKDSEVYAYYRNTQNQ
jgi:cAMP-dependent protein kinase regulator